MKGSLGCLFVSRPCPWPKPRRALEETSGLSPSGPYRSLKQAGLVLLCAAWIMLGLFGHDPWKPDDATSFGIAYDMLRHGDYVVPRLGGVASPERPPLFYALAAATAGTLAPVLSLHDAARVANAICLGLALWLLALTGRELYGKDFRWLPVLLFVGCIGLWDRAHYLAPDIGLLAAYALALYALALAPRRFALGGALLGLAAGLAYLCKGALAPALIASHRPAAAPVRRLAHAPPPGEPGHRARRGDTADRGMAACAVPARSGAAHGVAARAQHPPVFRADTRCTPGGLAVVRQESAVVRVARATVGAVDALGTTSRRQRRSG